MWRGRPATLPLEIGGWQGQEAAPLADDVLAQLGVDDYVSRDYVRSGLSPVGIYIGYYASQRQGDTIHSPQNCLPGAGWRPVETGVGNLQADGRTVTVNRSSSSRRTGSPGRFLVSGSRARRRK
jgi:EpsI family protein